MGATLPIPPGKGIVQPLGGGRAARSLSPLSLPGSGADSPPHSVSPAWSKEVSLGGISGGFKAASSAPAPGRRHQRRSLPSAESSQQQICSAPKRNGFPQPSASMLAVPGSDLIGPRDPPSCRVRGPAAAADGQLRSRLTPEPGKGPNPGEGHHKHLMKWIWRRWGWRGGYDRPAEQSWEEMSSSPRSLCPASPQSSRGHRS